MPPYALSTTSRALYRVFIAPTQLPTLSTSLSLFPQTPLNHTQIRLKHFKKDLQRHSLTDTYTLDRAIRASHVSYVDLAGVYHADVPLHDALASFNKVTNHLLQVSAVRVDEHGNVDPDDLPVCKVISKAELRQQHGKKLDIERRNLKGTGGSRASPKNLELNWAIAGGDLKHRVKKLVEFLAQGRKVEVMFGPRNRGRVATEKECREVLEKVREAVREVKGASEAKEAEGFLGGVMTLVFEGRKLPKEEKDAEKEEGEKVEAVEA